MVFISSKSLLKPTVAFSGGSSRDASLPITLRYFFFISRLSSFSF